MQPVPPVGAGVPDLGNPAAWEGAGGVTRDDRTDVPTETGTIGRATGGPDRVDASVQSG